MPLTIAKETMVEEINRFIKAENVPIAFIYASGASILHESSTATTWPYIVTPTAVVAVEETLAKSIVQKYVSQPWPYPWIKLIKANAQDYAEKSIIPNVYVAVKDLIKT